MITKPATLTQLFAAERARVVRLIGRIVGCRATAEDLAQDAFLRLWNRGDSVGDTAVEPGYLFRTAQNLALDHLRAQRVRSDHAAAVMAEQDASDGLSPHSAFAARQELEALQAALYGLPDRTQRVFLLNRLDGLSYADIARRLEVSVSTVEKDMIRALDACRRCRTGRRSP